MDVYEAVIRRRSIRWFKDVPVPYEVLTRCVDAARLAPAARNNQLCDYVIVDDERLLPKVFDTIGMWAGQPRPQGGAAPGHRPKAYVVILVDTARQAEVNASARSTICDVGMAAENLILTALEQGVAACALFSFKESELKQALNIPNNYEVGMVIALGYPDESPVVEVAAGSTKYWVDERGVRHVPKRKLADVLHRNRFQ